MSYNIQNTQNYIPKIDIIFFIVFGVFARILQFSIFPP